MSSRIHANPGGHFRSPRQAHLVATTGSRELPSLLLSSLLLSSLLLRSLLLSSRAVCSSVALLLIGRSTTFIHIILLSIHQTEQKRTEPRFSRVCAFNGACFYLLVERKSILTFHPSRNSFLTNSELCPTDMTDFNETRHTGRTFVAKPVLLCCDSNIVTNTTIHNQNPSSLFTRSRFF